MSRTVAMAALAALLTLPACDRTPPAPQPTAIADPERQQLGTVIAATPGLSAFTAAIKAADFFDALDSGAPYTLLAPTDAALATLGTGWSDLALPANEARLGDVLREHVIPGYLSPREIEATIDRHQGKPITMHTAGNGTVTFARHEGALTITGPSGTVAHVAGAAVRARNGAAIPIDRLLVDLPPR